MPENSPIGHVILMKNEVPRRHPGRGLNAALQLGEIHNRINKQNTIFKLRSVSMNIFVTQFGAREKNHWLS